MVCETNAGSLITGALASKCTLSPAAGLVLVASSVTVSLPIRLLFTATTSGAGGPAVVDVLPLQAATASNGVIKAANRRNIENAPVRETENTRRTAHTLCSSNHRDARERKIQRVLNV
jgi:hypothetical protein